MSETDADESFLVDGLAALAADGRPFRPSAPGVILVVLDHSGGLIATRGFGEAAAIEAAGLDALRAAVGDRAVVLPGPIDRAPLVLFDTAVHAPGDLVSALLDQLARPLQLTEEAHFVQSRLGVATAVALGTADLGALVRAAFGAAHVAMETGVLVHEAAASLVEEIRREARLRTAMARAVRGDFELHYQPIVDLATTRVLGYESLLRWRSGDELLAPPAFLAASEETSLILPIGRIGTRAALGQVARWNEGRADGPLFMAVNYSARQLSDVLLLPHVERALDELELSASTLWVEITERDLIDFGSPATRTIEALAELGCVICIDDLGTGFAALRYLADLPVNVAKIDRSLVCSAAEDPYIRSIVGAVCDISRSLGIETVAEGVEHEDQIPMLRELGFTHAQGFHFGRPAPAADLVAS